jgi:hypothetical protein
MNTFSYCWWQTHARSVLECGSSLPLWLGRDAGLPWQSAGGPAHSKTWRSLVALLGFFLLHSSFCLRAQGQSYSIDWYKIAGGGGTSTNGTYQVTGTIGQPDASGAMTDGSYSVTGGFWALIAVVQAAGVPKLSIVPNGPNSVQVLWPDPATNTYTLQQNSALNNSGGWATTGYAISSANGTNRITISPPAGNLFFRLKQ